MTWVGDGTTGIRSVPSEIVTGEEEIMNIDGALTLEQADGRAGLIHELLTRKATS